MIKLTIVCCSYNQENYITEAIESFLMQRTNFDFEVIIADDASADNTPKIIQSYADKYPNIIKPILREKNLGLLGNFLETMEVVKSEYVCIIGGDDYYIDPLKLQKQVDFLDNNRDFSMHAHNLILKYEDNPLKFNSYFNKPIKDVFDINNDDDMVELYDDGLLHPATVLFRWQFNEKSFKDRFPKNMYSEDAFIIHFHFVTGKVFISKEAMVVYRKHSKSYSANVSFDRLLLIFNQYTYFLDYAKGRKFETNFSKKHILNNQIKNLIAKRSKEELEIIKEKYPDYYENYMLSIKPTVPLVEPKPVVKQVIPPVVKPVQVVKQVIPAKKKTMKWYIKHSINMLTPPIIKMLLPPIIIKLAKHIIGK